MQLKESQVAVLETASADEATSVDAVAEATDLPPETVTGAVFELEEEGLVAIEERVDETISLTDEGVTYADERLPKSDCTRPPSTRVRPTNPPRWGR